MKESGWKGVAQSLKRLSVVGKQKFLKLKFWWQDFVSRAKELLMVEGGTSLIFVPFFLFFAFSEKLPLFSLPFLFVFFLGLGLLVMSNYRFRKISLRSLSLKSFEAFKWKKVFNRTLLESEKATQTFCKSFKPDENSTCPFLTLTLCLCWQSLGLVG